MIQTQVYYPIDSVKFRRNIQGKWQMGSGIANYNSEESMLKRTDKVLIYHVLNSTVFIHAPSDDRGRVNITANLTSTPGGIESAKSLLENISEIKLMERK